MLEKEKEKKSLKRHLRGALENVFVRALRFLPLTPLCGTNKHKAKVRKEIKGNYRMKFNPINDFHFTEFVKGGD